jgi:hypothetical protein
MTKTQLNLFQSSATFMGQLCERAPEIMWSKTDRIDFMPATVHYFENGPGRHTSPGAAPASVNRTKD